MKKYRPAAPNATGRKDRLSSILFAIVAAVTVLRSTWIEAPHIEQRAGTGYIDYQVVTLLVSTVLLLCWGVFWIARIAQDRFCLRRTWFGIFAVLFLAAGIVSAAFASDRRAAITDIVALATPMAAAVVMVQVLSSHARIRLLLFLLLAIAVAAAAVSADQFFSSNQALVSDYESNPQAHLAKLGIEPGSLEQWMYEHRLYSKGVRGFLLTGNSTATFFLLMIFAGIGLCADGLAGLKRLTDRQVREHTLAAAICYALVTAILAAGLVMTQSKGGIGALLIGLALFAFLILCGRWFWKRRRVLAIVAVPVTVAVVLAAIGYGLSHGRLPGGNSMLVRWQYWVSAVRMIGDHPVTGVGGGNFSIFYPAYKIPAASETVQDPHNWVLSLLSQYGPLGLLAFLAAVLIPLYKTLQHRFDPAPRLSDAEDSRNGLWIGLLFLTAALLLIVRPLGVDTELLFAENVKSAVFAYLLLYFMPAAVFAGIFLLLVKASKGDASANIGRAYLTVALVCGIVAVFIHNLIDFAIFEPGVWGCLWLLIAVLTANMYNDSAETKPSLVLSQSKKTILIVGILFMMAAYLFIAVVGPLRADCLFRRALTSEYGRLDWIQKAVAADPLSPDAAYHAAGMLAQVLKQTDRPDERITQEALELASVAHQRDPADYKPLRLQAEIFASLAAHSEGPKRKQQLTKALAFYEQALQRYPGSDRMHFEAAQIAESLGRFDTALKHYKAAVEIENSYRAQFKRMYPEKTEIISRLGQANYQTAEAKIKELAF